MENKGRRKYCLEYQSNGKNYVVNLQNNDKNFLCDIDALTVRFVSKKELATYLDIKNASDDFDFTVTYQSNHQKKDLEVAYQDVKYLLKFAIKEKSTMDRSELFTQFLNLFLTDIQNPKFLGYLIKNQYISDGTNSLSELIHDYLYYLYKSADNLGYYTNENVRSNLNDIYMAIENRLLQSYKTVRGICIASRNFKKAYRIPLAIDEILENNPYQDIDDPDRYWDFIYDPFQKNYDENDVDPDLEKIKKYLR